MYHDVIREGENNQSSGLNIKGADAYKISEYRFGEQVKLASEITGKTNLEIIFTFDDGGISSSKTIAPILEKYGYKGLFFIPTSFIGKPGFLSENEIRNLSERGHIIGSHSHLHPSMMNRMTYEENLEEWNISCGVLSEIISKPILNASVPGGWYGPIVALAAENAGIKYLYTSEPVATISKEKSCEIIGRFAIRENTGIETVQSILEGTNLARESMNLKWKLARLAKRFY